MKQRIITRPTRRTRFAPNWECIFILLIFPLLCWAAIIGGALFAVWGV
jgi:hypothetical protein